MSGDMQSNVLAKLEAIIADRASGADGDSSYTAKLLASGTEKCARKFGEEAIELILAAVEENPEHLTAEAADVLYHLLVVLRAGGVPLDDVMQELATVLSGSLGLNTLFERLVPQVSRLMGAERTTLFLYDAINAEIWSKVFPNLRLHREMAVYTGGEIGWSICLKSPSWTIR